MEVEAKPGPIPIDPMEEAVGVIEAEAPIIVANTGFSSLSLKLINEPNKKCCTIGTFFNTRNIILKSY